MIAPPTAPSTTEVRIINHHPGPTTNRENSSPIRNPNQAPAPAPRPAARAFVCRPVTCSTDLIPVPIMRVCSTGNRSEEHTSELQSRGHLVCRLLLEKKKKLEDCITTKHTH